ncbi:chitin deacetylase 1 [Mollisia scopiformis]|uniref:Chitin deacetylase 1 n=1 Tax=Mollisia scopiformis TaxID=149040 RepID=A0A132B5A9_MOLSC|nr:chitin deacetylase 1 [Mollisia scopiformis]KUJ06857.1 chitin deacetylase 1 [Mollisia scopiformis]
MATKQLNGIGALDAPSVDPLQGTKYDFPRDSVGFGRKSLNPEWPNGAKIAVSFVINYEEGAERTVLNGDERSENALWEQSHVPFRMGERATNVESDYDYGSRVGVWRLLDIFERHRMPVTAYAVGMALEKNPEVAKAFVDGGHEVASHAYRWIDYHGMKPDEEKEYIIRQLESLKKSTGQYPVGWYYGRLSPYSKGLLHEVFSEMNLPLLYEADTYADDIPYWVDVPVEKDHSSPRGMLMMPYTYDCNDLRYAVPAGAWGSMGAFEEYLKSAFDVLYAEGQRGSPKMMTIGLHCRISGKPGRSTAVEKFVEYIASKEDVWVTTRKDIALHFREKFPYQKGHLA